MRRATLLIVWCLGLALTQIPCADTPANAATVNIRLGATDGYAIMPDGTAVYGFGWADLTRVSKKQIYNNKGKAEFIGPLIEVYEGDDVYLTVTNLGMVMRPDLDDSHTIHWHGFRNQIPIYDGVPEPSIAVPVGRDFVYYYKPLDPGTYMYHCHFEPVEHIQMGMVGPLIVRPALEKTLKKRKFVFNDTATEFDREFLVFVSEIDPVAHHDIESVQEPDWTDYKAGYWVLNGRAYPDTMAPASALPYQPFNSRIQANAGEKVLLRFMNLGFEQHPLQLLGIPMKVVGMDAQPLRGLNGEDLSVWKSTIYIGAGKTFDVIFQAPNTPGEYPFYNRNYCKQQDGSVGVGGMLTSVVVHSPRTLPRQRAVNE